MYTESTLRGFSGKRNAKFIKTHTHTHIHTHIWWDNQNMLSLNHNEVLYSKLSFKIFFPITKHPYSITKQNVNYKWYMLLPFTLHCLFTSDMAHVTMKKLRERIMALWPRKRGKRTTGGNFGNLDIKYNGLGSRWIKE